MPNSAPVIASAPRGKARDTADGGDVMSGARRVLGLGATLVLAITLCIALGGRSAARSADVAPAPAPEGDCNPCPLSRVIVDQPAWDETVTVVDSPARTVHHHDLVTAERTVAHTVLT